MELKEKLVALRKEKGLTQSAVAEKLDVSRQAISRWEYRYTGRKDESMWSKTVVVGLCLLLFVLVFIIFMYLQGIEVPNVAFGLAGALIGILTKCILNSWKK